MKIVQLFLSIMLFGILSSCGDDEINPTPPEVFDYFIVASKKTTIVDADTGQVNEFLILKRIDKMDWFTLNIDDIRSFEYEAGYEYEIEVRTIDLNEGKDIPLYGYELSKVLSKVKKETEGLPEDF